MLTHLQLNGDDVRDAREGECSGELPVDHAESHTSTEHARETFPRYFRPGERDFGRTTDRTRFMFPGT